MTRAWGLGVALLAVGGVAATAGTPRAERRPNIVLIVADDLGYGDIGVQGNPDVPTPHIDSLAREGVRFTAGYVSCPVCSPTRAGLLTGRYQQRFGNEFNPGPPTADNERIGLALAETTLAQRLRERGYRTGLVGKWHLGHGEPFRPQRRGFDEFFGFLGGAHTYRPEPPAGGRNPIMRGDTPIREPEYLTDAFGREAVAFVDRHRSDPFFLYLAFNAVHTPMEAGPALGRFEHIPDPRRRTFAAMLGGMDDAIGRVLQALRRHGLEKDTLVFFHSDNGGPTRTNTSRNDPFSGFKGQLWEGGIRVPFLARWPGRLPAGKTYDRPVIQLDLFPTALAAAGISPDAGAKLDGVNLLPYVRGEAAGDPHERLYWRFGDRWAIREGRWKLVDADGPARLFDLEADPGERRDVSSQEPRRREALKQAWEAWDRELPRARR